VNARGPLRDIGEYLDIIDPDGSAGLEFDAPHDAVPIRLRVIRHTVGVLTHIDQHAIVDANGEAMFAGGQTISQIEDVRHAQAFALADLPAIHPDGREPMATLQVQRDPLAAPVRGDRHGALVPGRSHIVVLGL
jgi:hypothetical protein